MTDRDTHASHLKVLPDLDRIGAQISDIARAVRDEEYCVEILSRLRAARSELKRVEDKVLGEHVEHCVTAVAESGDARERDRKIAEILTAIGGDAATPRS